MNIRGIYSLCFGIISFNTAHASNTNSSGLPQLDLSTYPSLIFWSIVSLFVLYFVISFIVVPKISSVLNNREQNIQNNLIKAKSLKEESDSIIDKVFKEQNNARVNARTLLETTIKETKLELEERDKSISKDMNIKINNALSNLNNQKNAKVRDLLKDINTISEMIITELVGIKTAKNKLDIIIKSTSEKVLKEN